jgi:hypothetical protein
MKRRIALDIETSTDGERCDPGCSHRRALFHDRHPSGRIKQSPAGIVCGAFNAVARGELPTPPRLPACIEAERKALAMGGE